MNQFCEMKGIKRELSVARTPQQNGVAEKKNRTLIEAARTMLADSKLPTTFWAEAVNTACYVQNRVLVIKLHNKTPYELFHGRTPTLSFMRPFECPVTILNTLDHLGKFDGKANEGFFVGTRKALPLDCPLGIKQFFIFQSQYNFTSQCYSNQQVNMSGNPQEILGHCIDQCPKKIISDVLKSVKAPRKAMRGVPVGQKSKSCQPSYVYAKKANKDKKNRTNGSKVNNIGGEHDGLNLKSVTEMEEHGQNLEEVVKPSS
ncbi:ribonuclease H-like domain-containing protein [Tanacetum coccineum]